MKVVSLVEMVVKSKGQRAASLSKTGKDINERDGWPSELYPIPLNILREQAQPNFYWQFIIAETYYHIRAINTFHLHHDKSEIRSNGQRGISMQKIVARNEKKKTRKHMYKKKKTHFSKVRKILIFQLNVCIGEVFQLSSSMVWATWVCMYVKFG